MTDKVKKFAIKSYYAEKKRNLFLIITVTFVAALLTFSVLTVQNIMRKKKTEVKSLHQGTFYDVNDSFISSLSNDKDIKKIGIYAQVQEIKEKEYGISIRYYNNTLWSIGNTLIGKAPKDLNEVVVTEGLLNYIGKDLKVGDEILLSSFGMEKFIISGIVKGNGSSNNTFPVFISEKYYSQIKSLDDRYTVYIWLNDAQYMDKDEAAGVLDDIAARYGIQNYTVSIYYDYINSKDAMSNNLLYFVIALTVMGTAGIVIYTMFYISINMKLNQYGQLCTIGATKKQIKTIVKKEGNMVAVRGIPFGIFGGMLISFIVQNKGWNLYYTIISVLSISIICIIWIRISINAPAKIAANVSPITAMKGQENANWSKRKKKSKKITPVYMSILNLQRNRRKTIISIISMSICGVLLVCGACYQKSFTAEGMARAWEFPYGDFKIINSVLLQDGNEAYSLASSQISNPLNDTIKKEILEIDGVEEIKEWYSTSQTFSVVNSDISDEVEGQVLGYDEECISKMENELIEGTVAIDEITENNGIVISDPKRVKEVYGWNVSLGDKVELTLLNCEGEKITESFTVMGITGARDGFNGYIFRMPIKKLSSVTGNNCISSLEIVTDHKKNVTIEKELEKIVNQYTGISLQKLSDTIEENKRNNETMFMMIYFLVALFGVFAVINNVNITMTNILVRNKELAILEAIGMSHKQLRSSLLMEGIITSGISIIITLLIGSPIGAIIGYELKKAGMSDGFKFPIWIVLGYISIVLLIQVILGIYVIKCNQKTVLIDRMRCYD